MRARLAQFSAMALLAWLRSTLPRPRPRPRPRKKPSDPSLHLATHSTLRSVTTLESMPSSRRDAFAEASASSRSSPGRVEVDRKRKRKIRVISSSNGPSTSSSISARWPTPTRRSQRRFCLSRAPHRHLDLSLDHPSSSREPQARRRSRPRLDETSSASCATTLSLLRRPPTSSRQLPLSSTDLPSHLPFHPFPRVRCANPSSRAHLRPTPINDLGASFQCRCAPRH
jgi:hypothetical protein